MIGENLRRVRERIAAAARSAGRDPAGIRLICVTKGVSIERVREAAEAGGLEIGENRVQEAQEKQENMSTGYKVPGTLPPVRWHLIGRLQRNKAKTAARLFDVIHSVDSAELIGTLEKEGTLRQAQHERPLEILIQVNVSGQATQGGCRPEEVEGLAEAILNSKNLKWTGLMTLAPYNRNPEEARPVFRRLREIRDHLEERFDEGHRLHLSMGMSGDFEAAVQEGATMVRIGTAIFGERK